MSDAYDDMIRNALKKAQEKYGFGGGDECLAIVKAIIETESSFDPNADNSRTHARGLMQLLRAAAKDMGYDYDDLWDPARNIECGVLYLAWCIKQREGDCWQGVAGYKAGVGNVKKAGGDIEKMDESTRDYVSKVRERAKKGGSGGKKTKKPAQPAQEEPQEPEDELDRILKKTEILERLKKLAEGGDWQKKLQATIDAMIAELEREAKALGGPGKAATPGGAPPKEGEKGDGPKKGGGAGEAEKGQKSGDEGKGKEGSGDEKKEREGDDEYVVEKDDDSLWKIAKKLLKKKTGEEPTNPEIQKAVDKIQKENPEVDPKRLRPGKTRLKLPPL